MFICPSVARLSTFSLDASVSDHKLNLCNITAECLLRYPSRILVYIKIYSSLPDIIFIIYTITHTRVQI